MSRVRQILRTPTDGKHYYIVDASFLVHYVTKPANISNAQERRRARHSHDWWKEIENQLKSGHAKVFVPDICIAESFKALHRRRTDKKWFDTDAKYKYAKRKLRNFVSTSTSELTAANRDIAVHDISTNRDIIISVDRFFSVFHRHNLGASVPDLILLATAKYLIDFFDIPKDRTHIVTEDEALWKGLKKIQELPNGYKPSYRWNQSSYVFVNVVAAA